jgi:orotate phosphoribosyltransferase
MTNEHIIAEKLLQVNAIKLQPEQPFTWASGWKSPIYCDNRKSLGHPFIRDFIKSELCNVLFEQFDNADAIAGVATAGIPWGAMAADQLKKPFCYIRSSPKAHGLGNQIEGFYEPGMKLVVIEDLVSTGKSSMEAIVACKNAKLDVIGCVAIFTYLFSAAKDLFNQNNVPLVCLSNYDALLEVGLQKAIISQEMLGTLQNWRNSPQTWQGI